VTRKKFRGTEDQFRKALLKWLNRQHEQLRANVHGDDDASLWCKEEAELVDEHIQTVESLIFVNDALKASADEAHRQADLAYDRIEELEQSLKAAQDDAKEAEAYAGELEAKLAKAVDVRQWYHYPIEMPLSADGQGPATIGVDARRITYEVWDALLHTHASFDNLPDAINEAMRLNFTLAELTSSEAAYGEHRSRCDLEAKGGKDE